ncbi:hypothetical protein M422DRAFT_110254, partial [Sphaerobolus stellatus SS14]
VALPSAPLKSLTSNIGFQAPLTRRGHGPGLIIFLPAKSIVRSDDAPNGSQRTKSLDPEPVQKWAEEGFAVVGITYGHESNIEASIQIAVDSLIGSSEVDIKDKFGAIVYGSQILPSVLSGVSKNPLLACAVCYGGQSSDTSVPLLCHIPTNSGGDPIKSDSGKIVSHKYASPNQFFVLPQSNKYHAGSAELSHTRSLVFLRKHLGGPYFDLEAIWDEHTYFEFEIRSVAKTMGTMVTEPYVNHVPTMTGGMGRENLTAFYRDHFIFSNPPDTSLDPVSRTVGADRIIDEFICKMTHTKMVDWLLPGVPPSGNKLEIPMMSVVNVRGDRLYHEHIWWDQATALRQAGVLPTHLPYPYPNGGNTLRLPVTGTEAARLLADETDGKSNEML